MSRFQKWRIDMEEVPKLNITKSIQLFEKAKNLVPGGLLGARRPDDFIRGEYPIFFENGKGCRQVDCGWE
jgi:glutamate-1-semialdehyde aminotransferase